MAADPYQTLGVKKDASDADIKSAYRGLAKKNHPDLNPGNEAAKTRFSEISVAYELLSDKDKRAAFDRGEIDASGQPRQQQFYSDFAGRNSGGAGAAGGQRYRHPAGGAHAGNFDPPHFSDFFSSMFGAGGGGAGGTGGGPRTAPEPLDAHYSVEIEFLDAAKGGAQRVTMPNGKGLDIVIPEGVNEGQKLRLKGQGNKGKEGQAGDAYVELHIRPHPSFTRDGNDITIELPVGFHESVLGAKVSVPTVHGPVTMAIPKGATTGQTLRLKGKGIKGGDQFVRLKVVMPAAIDPELERLVAEWAKTHAYDPRATGGK